jgi:hypothetical protein
VAKAPSSANQDVSFKQPGTETSAQKTETVRTSFGVIDGSSQR